MTIEFFEKMCDIDSDKTYVSKAKLNGTELPLYAVEEKINICNEKEYKYYSYNQRTNNYSMRSLLWDEAEYIEFLYNHRTDELQKLIDSGKLYRTVMQRVHKANKLIDSTLHEWESQDEEIILAKKSGNFIGCGEVNTEQYYYYYYKTDKGSYKASKIKADDCEIIYTKDTPHIDTIVKSADEKATENPLTFEPLLSLRISGTGEKYKIYIPEGSITTDFQVDME